MFIHLSEGPKLNKFIESIDGILFISNSKETELYFQSKVKKKFDLTLL